MTLIVLICNGFCFVKIRSLHSAIAEALPQQEIQRRKREKKLFIQFFIISLYLLLLEITYNIILRFWNGKWNGFAGSVTYIGQLSINAYVNVGMNSVIRQQMAGCWKKMNSTVSVVTVTTESQKLENAQTDRQFIEVTATNLVSVPNTVAEG